ncbi:DUF1127 domain-containing protein [Roseovarius gahaiensis]|uniref:DUF1127 domain-containing protein n=1 Tax=Roseovarius gahaiensis TaxID=2716691 RepID=A0A967EJB6_9RHOB|nr:DUF1127 domain-containing protein [Roseovarius gahaiensis]NHQ74267.1 DUF1127 domain-containing protein [Roseovarius gahaiensis]
MTHLSDSTHIISARRTAPLLILRRMLELQRQRRALSRLNDRALQDIGLTRSMADAEARRPLWDIPAASLGARS